MTSYNPPAIPNNLYKLMKWVVMIFLPALAVFYPAFAKIWNLPYQSEVPFVIGALITFLGIFLQSSVVVYNRTNALGSTGYPFTDNIYDTMRWVTAVFLPAFATFFLAVAPLFDIQFSQQIYATMMAVVVFFGALLQQANAQMVKLLKERAIAYTEAVNPVDKYKKMGG